VVNLREKNGVSRKFIIISELLKSTHSSRTPLSSEVKSSRMWSNIAHSFITTIDFTIYFIGMLVAKFCPLSFIF